MSEEVCLAAWIPANRAPSTTSSPSGPRGALWWHRPTVTTTHLARATPSGERLGRDVDHAGLTVLVDVGQGAALETRSGRVGSAGELILPRPEGSPRPRRRHPPGCQDRPALRSARCWTCASTWEKGSPNCSSAAAMIADTLCPGSVMHAVPAASRAGPKRRRRATAQPPIIDMERAGLRKPGSLIPWPGNLAQTAWRNKRASSASVPPFRKRSRTVRSSSENRQFRSAPSAVTRRRLQVPQNGSETLEIKPISPIPSAKRNRSAGAVPTGSESGSRGQTCRDALEHLATRDELVPVPLSLRVKRHELDEAHDAPGVRAKEAKSRISSSFWPRRRTTLTLRGVRPAFSAASMAFEHDIQLSPPAYVGEPIGPQRITTHVDPPQSGRGQLFGHFASSVPLVVMARSSNPTAESRLIERWQALADQRFAAGDAERGDAETLRHPGQPGDLVERQQLLLRQEGEPFLGHAVDAAQIAAIGHRNAKVVVDPPVAVDQRPLERHGLRRCDRHRRGDRGEASPRSRRGPGSSRRSRSARGALQHG